MHTMTDKDVCLLDIIIQTLSCDAILQTKKAFNIIHFYDKNILFLYKIMKTMN